MTLRPALRRPAIRPSVRLGPDRRPSRPTTMSVRPLLVHQRADRMADLVGHADIERLPDDAADVVRAEDAAVDRDLAGSVAPACLRPAPASAAARISATVTASARVGAASSASFALAREPLGQAPCRQRHQRKQAERQRPAGQRTQPQRPACHIGNGGGHAQVAVRESWRPVLRLRRPSRCRRVRGRSHRPGAGRDSCRPAAGPVRGRC